jgi:hypothetical protein
LLYRPVKTFLEGLGFVVKGEIGGCDLLALRGDDPPVVVIGELKLTFNLELVLQGVDRAAACDEVWLVARLSSREKGRENDARFRLGRAEGRPGDHFLHSHGVGTAHAVRIFKAYGADAV